MNLKTILVFVAVILLSGCTGTTEIEAQDNTINDGIDVKLLENSLADSYYEGDPFNIELQIDNIGDYEVPSNSFYLTLTGFNPTSFGKNTEDLKLSNSEILEKIFDTNNQSIVSGTEFMSYGDLCHINDLFDPYALNMKFYSCYPYQTEIKSTVCFGEHRSDLNEICTVNEEKEFINSRAPVQATSLSEVYVGNDEYRFMIDFKNLGSGEVIDSDSVSSCTGLSSNSLSAMSIVSITLDGEELINDERLEMELPSDKDKVRITNNEASVYFKIKDLESTDYVSDLQVVLNYGYKKSFEESTIIYDVEGVSGCEL
tara:strand:- start:1051 stop:1992 length:942 start_codon:yes stop_codon:yes gene_type:complete